MPHLSGKRTEVISVRKRKKSQGRKTQGAKRSLGAARARISFRQLSAVPADHGPFEGTSEGKMRKNEREKSKR